MTPIGLHIQDKQNQRLPIKRIISFSFEGAVVMYIDAYKNNFNSIIHDKRIEALSWSCIAKNYHILPHTAVGIEESEQIITDWLNQETI